MSNNPNEPRSDEVEAFEEQVLRNISALGSHLHLASLSRKWIEEGVPGKYSYNFTWLGIPIIQYPQDIIALQEIIWRTRPEIIVETGIARGGSLIFFASLMELIGEGGRVIGIDIDIRESNRRRIEAHPLFKRISLVQSSSIASNVIDEVGKITKGKKTMIVLDSDHSHQHVLAELRLYSAFVSLGCYLVVLDTIIEDLPDSMFSNRSWGRGNNPKTAVHEFLAETDNFEIDSSIPSKLLITVAPDGYLVRVKTSSHG
jgi:cephalosporin hydroxylase